MIKPTLLFVEEVGNTLSNKITSNETINVVLLRFKQNMFFTNGHLHKTSHLLCFILDKERPLHEEVLRFETFCIEHGISINHFYNDSEYNQELIQKFASELKLPGSLNEYQARCVRDKVVMKNMFQKIDCKTMQYTEMSSLEDVTLFSEKHGGFPVIVKWRKGLSSKEVYRFIDSEWKIGI